MAAPNTYTPIGTTRDHTINSIMQNLGKLTTAELVIIDKLIKAMK